MAPHIAPSTEPISDAVLRPDELLPTWLVAVVFAGEAPGSMAADVLAGEALGSMVVDAILGEALELLGPEIVGEGEAVVKLVCAFSVTVAVVFGTKVSIFSAAFAVKITLDVAHIYITVSPLLNSSFPTKGAADPLYECKLRSQQGSEYN